MGSLGEGIGRGRMNYPDKREITKNMLKFGFNVYKIAL
jgi:hypothetical protein